MVRRIATSGVARLVAAARVAVDGDIGAGLFDGLRGCVAVLQADDETRSESAASSLRGEAQPWKIMPDWTCR